MNDHYALAHAAARLAELRAEADRERLAASARAARDRGHRRLPRLRSFRATTSAATTEACCA